MNNALKKAKFDIKVATVTKTQRDNNIVLTISEKYIAKALLKQRDIWKHIFEVKSIKKNEKWYKIVIHSLKINIFNMKIKIKYLRIELKKYNSELKLIINSIWLSKDENKARKNHASTILTFKIEAEAQRYLKKWFLAARSTYWTVEYWDYRSNDQCQKCQTFEHLQNKCNRSSRCLYCERNHQIWNHKCQLFMCKDEQSCNHMISRFFIFYFFIKCMQSMTMTLSKRCAYVRLHVSWSKSLLYIFSLINHIDSLRKQALSIKQLLSLVLSFSHLFMFFSLYSFVLNSHFLVAIQVLFKYFSIAILSILMINNINIVFMFLNCAFALSCNCSAL